MNVHDGHNTDSLYRYVVKCDTPNDLALANLATTEYMIIGIFQLYQMRGGVLIPHILSSKGIGKTPTPLYLHSGIFSSVRNLTKLYFLAHIE